MINPLLTLAMILSTDPTIATTAPRLAAAETLLQAIETSHEVRSSGGTGLAPLVSGGQSAAKQLGTSHMSAVLVGLVNDGRWRAISEPMAAVSLLEDELSALQDDLAFEPIMEAELPAGFPPPTPVREIELKQYPAYRSASAEIGVMGSGVAFWKLFMHIKSNEIAMTAPVEMSYEEGDRGLRETKMAFLYGDTELGAVGPDGKVEVVDADSGWVVSMGCRGRESDESLAEAQGKMLSWIAAQPDLESAGPLRVMGYNSPMVRGDRRYYEVQIPVTRAGQAVVDFSDAEELASWRPVNDSVMGGHSKSRIWSTQEGLGLFAGKLSLENNGGFASVRSESIEGRLLGAARIVLRVRGDGNTYKLRLRSNAGGAISYQAPFQTVASEWSEHSFEASDFAPVWRGQQLDNVPALELADVTEVGILISDKQEGMFRLELAAIEKR